MPTITLPDGSQRSFDHPVSVAEVAASIGAGLAKATVAGKVDGKLVDACDIIDHDATLQIITPKMKRAGDHPPLVRPPGRPRGQAAVPDRQDGDRPGHRRRLLLRHRLRASFHPGRPGRDRKRMQQLIDKDYDVIKK
jgi:threonyl-tRNA synthetase